MATRIINGDCRAVLPMLAAGSVQCCVTSPPYYGLRDYGVAGQIGLEPTPDEYVAEMVAVFREVRRVLRDDGVLWLNLGDSYAGSRCGPQGDLGEFSDRSVAAQRERRAANGNHFARAGAKPKDLLGIPWLVAFALRADGWYLRRDVVWHKLNPMPESVTDRPSTSHEFVFLLTKAADYFYDAAAVVEKATGRAAGNRKALKTDGKPGFEIRGGLGKIAAVEWQERNARSVWTIATQPFTGQHFATMPRELARRCILAGSRPGDTVLDPFGGAGTTGLVAERLGRNAVLVELNPEYQGLADARVAGDCPLFADEVQKAAPQRQADMFMVLPSAGEAA